MDEGRLKHILERYDQLRMLVVGDFFLDRYLILERSLEEVSLETGLDAHQVVDVRCSPGAAGTVTSNLRSLDVDVTALGVIGHDGEGYELKRGLVQRGVHTERIVECTDLFTPTYMKPMMREANGQEHELSRLDVKNRSPLPSAVEDHIMDQLRAFVPSMDGVIVVDQVQERNCGLITDRVRDQIACLARQYPEIVFVADSRSRIGRFQDVIIKSNGREAILSLASDQTGSIATNGTFPAPPQTALDLDLVRRSGRSLFLRNRKPVFLTVGRKGMLLFTDRGEQHIPAIDVVGEIDIVGAGDSVMAGIAASLCSGASELEAAVIGTLVASITIQQIGTTGAASRDQVLGRYRSLRLSRHA
jgi:rfaE bifunctional protein kinase chain/domain